MGSGAHSQVGSEQGGEIEFINGLIDQAGQMIGGQRVLDLEPFGGLTIPRRRGEAIEAGTVAGWGRADRCQEVEGPARPIQARMARTLGPFSAPLLGEGARASRPRMV